MTTFNLHSVDTAPEGAKPALKQAQKAFGMVPNLFAVFAESPALLNAHLKLSEELGKTDFSETERQIILITTSYENSCEYCVAAHTAIAGMAKVPEDVVRALRDGTPIADEKLEALRRFASAVVTEGGWVSEADVEAFLDAGYTKRHILEVILGVSMKTMSNYTNHVAQTPLDEAFEPARWSKPAGVGA